MPSPSKGSVKGFPHITAACIEGRPRSVRHRQHQFHRLHDALVAAGPAIIEALQDDNGFLRREAVLEYSLALAELRSTYESISLEAEITVARAVENGKNCLNRKFGVGIVYIKRDRTRSDVYGTLSPLFAALAAGNCIVVEMPNTTRRTTSILRKLLLESLDNDTFALSDAVPADEFLEQCVVVQQNGNDPDQFTSAKRLVSSPGSPWNIFFINRTADLKKASRSVLEAKFAFQGTSSFAPNVVFVHEAIRNLFLDCLSQDIQSFAGLETAESGKLSKAYEHLKFDSASDAKGRIGFIKDMQSYKVLSQSKGQSQTNLLLYSATSLDDMIDSIADLTGNPLETPSSAFIFASLPEANYISNAIAADFTCINTFPVELLIGPRFPKPMGVITDSTALPRYTRQMFEESRPVISTTGFLSKMLVNGLTLEEPSLRSQFLDWTERMQAPLKPTGQKLGKQTDFFLVGIGTGAGMVIGIPLVVLSTLVWKAVMRRW